MDSAGRPDDNVRLGIVLVATFALVIPIVGAAVKLLGQTVAIPQITWTRFMIQVIIISFVLALTTRELARPLPRPLWPLVLRGAAITLGSGLFYAALAVLPMAEATAILFIQPLILTTLAAIFLSESVGLVRLLAVGAGLVGAIIITGPNFSTLGWAALLPIGAAFCFAAASLITRAWAATAGALMFQFITAVTAVTILSAILSLGTAAGIDQLTPAWPSLPEIYLLLFAGIGSTITNLMLVQGFRIAPPSALAPFFYLEIVSATVIGAAVFGHIPGPATAFGAAMVIGAGLLVWWRESRSG
ncbi:MAG TPA: DMT family transporter [Hyphomicrobiaceae bacterium]|nr:DMT family transporter [Hyphomicrobiaceae bacterium]